MGDAADAVLRLPPFRGNRKLPLWYQVAQHLRASILATPPGRASRLPVEEDLATHYGISLMTMRQALGELEDEELITRQRGRGTFVNPRTSRQPMRLLGSVDAVVAQQASADVLVLGVEPGVPPAEFTELFPPGDRKVLRFRRLRKENGQVTSYAENFVVADVGAHIDTADLATMPMTAVLRDRLDVRIGRIDDTAEAMLPAPDIADLLGIPLTSPVLYCVGITRDTDGRVVDVASIHYRGDRFKFAVTLGTE
jgi:GntR family transcriptional regulator